ncbi:TonB-dependent receptor plug domain-containing protein [Sphingobacterium sp. SG20118]|uniref:TonB-dependent receptor plug domain-containing protein n=1 Tax=Sphingobacterium sp. SG20118 TaxID=3367156 RepID=UPI0037DFC5AC
MLPVFAQIKLTGTVKDSNGPLSGVTIQVKGNPTTGTATNQEGIFQITVKDKDILVFKMVGYAPQEIGVEGNRNAPLNVMLEPTSDQLDEVVVVGYGTQKKAVVSGAIASVKGEDLAKSSSVNLSNSFAGRLPGVTAMQAGGEPGGDGSTIRIRGINSLSGGNTSPLIVIDGVPQRAGGLDRINPNDVESVSVLKDASAAIYGFSCW